MKTSVLREMYVLSGALDEVLDLKHAKDLGVFADALDRIAVAMQHGVKVLDTDPISALKTVSAAIRQYAKVHGKDATVTGRAS